MTRKIWQPEHPTPGWLQAEKDSDLTIYLPHPDGDVPMFFRKIPKGEFRMGSRGNDPNEEPVHRVVIPEDFYMATFPVTQEEFAVWRDSPEYDLWFDQKCWLIKRTSWGATDDPHENDYDNRPRYPANRVTWWKAMEFARWLGGKGVERQLLTGIGMDENETDAWSLRLPSELEWEYACRAGTDTEYWNGDGEAALEEVAWFAGNSGLEEHPVGGKGRPNPWGLHDMHGNVWEWCLDEGDDGSNRLRLPGSCESEVPDRYAEGARVLRGGSWGGAVSHCRSAFRLYFMPGERFRPHGFRLALVPGPSSQPAAGGRWDAERGVAARSETGAETSICAKPPFRRAAAATILETSLIPMNHTTNHRALSSEDGSTWQQSGSERESQWPDTPDPSVVKLVLGRLGDAKDGDNWTQVLPILASGLKDYFPNLTHLHLWSLPMEKLGPLPEGLMVLDLRKCEQLATVPDVPLRKLDTLVLEECPNLSSVHPLCGDLPELRDLSFKSCPALPESTIQSYLGRAPQLQKFDASGCVKLRLIERWPSPLVDVRLDGCPDLSSLPDWPKSLRRLQLRGSAIESLDDFPKSLDYIDLGGMRRLSSLPTQCGQARTLFLFGSGILMPPASEHGENHDENVARRTRAYFDDVELTGLGDVKRCKLLVLGNGSAGKTCFSLNLVGENPHRTRCDYEPKEDRLGTTHGVQFHDWRATVSLGGKSKPVHLHIWDFGGQEIYHNTHRLFMGTGAVFVVMWNPDQVGKDPQPDASGHQDNWRPLRYWIDYIQLACPHSAQIAIVCSGRKESSPEIEQLLVKDSGDEQIRDHYPVFFIDSLGQAGQTDEFKQWLRERIGSIVTTQGSAVPSYWEIAQDLVKDWVLRFHTDPIFAAAHQRMDAATFGSLLEDEIKRRTLTGEEQRFEKLGDAVLAERPFMTEDRIRRTLAFLTHSGWIYWHPSLTGGRAIIGQKWALDGIYTILERVDGEEQSSIYLHMKHKKGRFTMRDLERWGWNREMPDEHDRELLVSFMVRIGLCVRLVKREELILGEPEYLSLSHLPKRFEFGLEIGWKSILRTTPTNLESEFVGANTQTIDNPQLHQGHWDQILGSLADRFGTDAQYARDGFFATNKDGQHVLITADLESDSLGGRIMVDVIGSNASELEKAIGNTISAFVKGEISRIKVDGDVGQASGERVRVTTVFFSYTWQPKDDNSHGREIPSGYEKPVDVLYEALDKLRPAIVPIRDKFLIRSGDSIIEHNQRIKTCDKVIVVHSDKYWKSPFCMDEFTMLLQSLLKRPDTIQSVLTVIEHHQTDFDRPGKASRGPFKDGYAEQCVDEFWETFQPTDFHPMLKNNTTAQKLKTAVLHLIRSEISIISEISGMHLKWEDAKADRIVEQVIERVTKGSPPPDRKV